MNNDFLNQTDAAKLLGLSPRTLEKMRVFGRGPMYRKHGRRVFYFVQDLLNWSDESRRRSTSDSGHDLSCRR
ncbi:MAG: helix-turn-helix domain-containing protein [Thermodesulfobacteriota bacterium]